MIPKKGDVVLVQHMVARTEDGEVKYVYREKGGHIRSPISHVYAHKVEGHHVVRTETGDSWMVRAANGDGYKFITVG